MPTKPAAKTTAKPVAKFLPQIELRDPKSLTPYHRNNKKHPKSQIDKLAGAIAEYDFDVPIVVDAKGCVIKGHGRREAAIQLGLKQVPVIVRADLSPAQVKAVRLADNRIAQEGKDDWEAIGLELEEIADLDAELLKYTGFDPAELDKFLDDSQIEVEPGEPGMGGQRPEPGFEDEEEGGEGGGGKSAPKPPAEKYPLAIVLTAMQKQQWEAVKEVLGEKSDTKALLKILELGVR